MIARLNISTLCFIFAVLLSTNTSWSQSLYSTTDYGSFFGLGNIFRVDTAGNYTEIFAFRGNVLANPRSVELIEVSPGVYYGLSGGQIGRWSNGVLFKFLESGDTIIPVLPFDPYSMGTGQSGPLCLGQDGKLYGMMKDGGMNNKGTLFSYDPATAIFIKHIDFGGTYFGETPYCGLTQANNGKLYGVTVNGGNSSQGILFSYDPISDVFIKHVDFAGLLGANPESTLYLAPNGLMYGVASNGGSANKGVVFTFNPNTNAFNVIHHFAGTSAGQFPTGALRVGPDGNLYSSVGAGPGLSLIYRVNIPGNTVSLLTTFNSLIGEDLRSPLVSVGGGRLISLAGYGGVNNDGTIFEYDINSGQVQKLFDFDQSSSGKSPSSTLVQANNGKYYGFTTYGGKGAGVFFSYDYSNNQFVKVNDLNYFPNGSLPRNGLMRARNGLLYGAAWKGGPQAGVIYSINPQNDNFVKLFDMNSSLHGSNPNSFLYQSYDGHLYGTNKNGGLYNKGTLFRYVIASDTVENLFDFGTTGHPGIHPAGPLVEGPDGNLYGITNKDGNVWLFSFDRITNLPTWIYSFNCPWPYCQEPRFLTVGKNGKIYGSNFVVSTFYKIFEYNCFSGQLTFIHNNAHGFGMWENIDDSTLICSTFWSEIVTMNTNTAFVTYEDTLSMVSEGSNPGSLIFASDSMVYGVCTDGGNFTEGTIIKFNPTNSTLRKLYDFNDFVDPFASPDRLTEVCSPFPILSVSPSTNNSVCQGDTILLIASGASNYIWSTGSMNDSLQIVADSTIKISLTGVNPGCRFTIPVFVGVSQGVNPNLNIAPPIVCNTMGPFNLSGGSPPGGNYSGIGVINNVFNPAIAGVGTHIISYTYINGYCTQLATDTIVVTNCSSVVEWSSSTIKISPIPCTAWINIEGLTNGIEYSYSIFNLEGKLIQKGKVTSDEQISIRQLPDGYYLLKILQTNTGPFNTKLIIDRSN